MPYLNAVMFVTIRLPNAMQSHHNCCRNEALSDSQMQQLTQYIQDHPDQYQEIMQDVATQCPGITEDQINQLLALAPPEFVNNLSDSDYAAVYVTRCRHGVALNADSLFLSL